MEKEIIVSKNSGFCFGVQNDVDKANELLKTNENIYCLGEIVHNKSVINDLEKKGLTFIENLQQANGDVIIRAHGIPKETYELAKELNIKLIDLTCPFVLGIHKIAEEYCKKDYFIVLVGKKQHPETIGTFSFCGRNAVKMEQLEEKDAVIKSIKESNIKNILIIVQTTFGEEKFEQIKNAIEESLDDSYNVVTKNTICKTTKNRQNEVAEISKNVDCMIIIGGKNSSNTKELYKIALNNCKNTYVIETYKELENTDVKKYNKIGIAAGASTPQNDIDEVKKFLY